MGDLQFWYILKNLVFGPYALVKLEGVDEFPNYITPPTEKFMESQVTLTKSGFQVLTGKDNWIQLKGIDQWYGGVHLHDAGVPWRWDEAEGLIQGG